jgi:hypothetical protein
MCQHRTLVFSHTEEDGTIWYECSECATGFWVTQASGVTPIK